MKQVDIQVERIRQAVRGIDAHHQRPVAELGQFDARCRGQAGFAYAALAAKEENPHASFYTEIRLSELARPCARYRRSSSSTSCCSRPRAASHCFSIIVR